MTEREIRQQVAAIMLNWLGAKKGDATHRRIIDTYNSHKPLPRAVRMSYTMNWCAATVSAAAIRAGLTDIMPPECSCNELIKLYKALGRWVENDACIPEIGDLILYSWTDSGKGDCVKSPNHVGIVTEVSDGVITVVEGNMGKDSRVGTRKVPINWRYIRGYCRPDYASKAKEDSGMVLYRYVTEMPEWARSAAEKAIRNGYIRLDESGAAGVYAPNLQVLVWMDRAGMLDKPAIDCR